MVAQKPIGYLKSLASSLTVRSDQVRDLIGSAHWYHEGRHKELLLLDVIRQHCPSSVHVSTGFVVSPRRPLCSMEQDILVVDTSTEAPVFCSGGLTIAFPQHVLAAVSVKTAFTAATLKEAATGLYGVRQIAAKAGVPPQQIWCAAMFFKEPKTSAKSNPSIWLKRLVESTDCCVMVNGASASCAPVDFFCTATDMAFVVDSPTGEAWQVREFHCGGLATALLLAHLSDHVAVTRKRPRAELADFVDRPEIKLRSRTPLSS